MKARSNRRWAWLVLAGAVLVGGWPSGTCVNAATARTPATTAPRWPRGLPSDEQYFPIAVWLQSPSRAAQYRAAGVNLYVGLWKGPTAAQLAELAAAGMPVICDQNVYALGHLDSPTIVGWMHGDEPDNAQEIPGGKGYGPPILPDVIVRDYRRIRTADPSRPVLLNLGQGVAWDGYIGRGVRRNHPEDYPGYVGGCDIASFDIYPAVHDAPEIAGRLEFVARGVERLVGWAGVERQVWSCIECTRIGNPNRKATPTEVRSEVWMALIRGAQGLIYFVHQFKPEFREAALLDDPEMLSAVTAINHEIRDLAPILNQPTVTNGVQATSSRQDAPIAVLEKRRGGETHLFAVSLGRQPTRATFRWPSTEAGAGGGQDVDIAVVGEDRRLRAETGGFADDFTAYAVHHYLVPR